MSGTDATETTASTATMQDRLVSAKTQSAAAMRDMEAKYLSDSVKVLSRVWILVQLCTLAVVIAGFAVGGDKADAGYAFIGVWVALLAIFLSVAGTLILRKYRTPAHHGMLTGLSFMMAQVMLISACVAGTRRDCEEEGTTSAQRALGAFSVLLFFLYLLFTWLLFKFKDDILGIEDDDEELGIEMNISDEEGAADAASSAKDEPESDLKMV